MHILEKQTMPWLLGLALAASTLVACGVAQSGRGSEGSRASGAIAATSSTPSTAGNASSPAVTSIVPTAPTSSAQSGSVTDQASLLKALEAAGASVAVKGSIQQPFLQVSGTQVTVDGQDVQVFEYSDAAAAQSDALKLADVLAGKGTTMVDWVAPPHAYQAGRLIALYVGDDAATLKRFQQVLGAPVAEQQRPQAAPGTTSSATPAVSSGTQPLDEKGLVDALQAKGLRVTSGDKVIQPFFSIEGRAYKVNDADVQVFEFPDEAGAQSSLAKLSPEGNPPNTDIDWIGSPHFYQAGRIVALYIGDDRTIIDALTAILGAQRVGQ